MLKLYCWNYFEQMAIKTNGDDKNCVIIFKFLSTLENLTYLLIKKIESFNFKS